MCGRYTFFPGEFADLRIRWNLDGDLPFLTNRYNICPSQDVPVIIAGEGRNRLAALRWGLIPSWSKDEKIGYKMINARAENLIEKPSFASLIERRRCLIPSNGFYEWRKDGAGRVPVYIYLKSQNPFAFAGLWEIWRKPDGNRLASCAIITCCANELIAPIHNRMPVILQAGDEARWLAVKNYSFEEVRSVLQPYRPELMSVHEVSTLVNTPVNDRLECTLPVRSSIGELPGL